jgi:hypothetical protein
VLFSLKKLKYRNEIMKISVIFRLKNLQRFVHTLSRSNHAGSFRILYELVPCLFSRYNSNNNNYSNKNEQVSKVL